MALSETARVLSTAAFLGPVSRSLRGLARKQTREAHGVAYASCLEALLWLAIGVEAGAFDEELGNAFMDDYSPGLTSDFEDFVASHRWVLPRVAADRLNEVLQRGIRPRAGFQRAVFQRSEPTEVAFRSALCQWINLRYSRHGAASFMQATMFAPEDRWHRLVASLGKRGDGHSEESFAFGLPEVSSTLVFMETVNRFLRATLDSDAPGSSGLAGDLGMAFSWRVNCGAPNVKSRMSDCFRTLVQHINSGGNSLDSQLLTEAFAVMNQWEHLTGADVEAKAYF